MVQYLNILQHIAGHVLQVDNRRWHEGHSNEKETALDAYFTIGCWYS